MSTTKTSDPSTTILWVDPITKKDLTMKRRRRTQRKQKASGRLDWNLPRAQLNALVDTRRCPRFRTSRIPVLSQVRERPCHPTRLRRHRKNKRRRSHLLKTLSSNTRNSSSNINHRHHHPKTIVRVVVDAVWLCKDLLLVWSIYQAAISRIPIPYQHSRRHDFSSDLSAYSHCVTQYHTKIACCLVSDATAIPFVQHF
jgi:hypothetical protein